MKVEKVPAVKVNGLVKLYEGKVKALDGVDLTVDEGKIFALLGPNGAGKTTLMRILTTQLKANSGEAYVHGLRIGRDDPEIRRSIGYIPQEMSVWTDITGFENLLLYAKIYRMPAPERRKTIRDSMELMSLGDAADRLVKTYSGGMIRRLEIACALIIRPKILFLDEPTIGLDPSARKIVWEELKRFRDENGSTIFFNTHYMDEADLFSDGLAIISRGRVAVTGTAEELKRSAGDEVVLLDVGDKAVGEDTMGKLRKLSCVSGVSQSGSEINLACDTAEEALPIIIDVFRRDRVALRSVSISRPSLDDVFFRYAGARLDGEGDAGSVRQVREIIERGSG